MFGTVLFTFVLFLQRVGRLFEILVRSSAPPPTVGTLFGLAIPFTLAFTAPLGVLVGVLIALSRMSSDGEITAMRAAGVPSRKVIAPVLILATLAILMFGSFSYVLFYELREVPPSTGAPRVGQQAPEFTLSDQDGKDVSLRDLGSKSKAVALIFYRGFW